MKADKPQARGEPARHHHPGGTAAGGVVGAVAAGAMAGSVAGPVGAAAGAVIGAAAGALAGRAFSDLIDPEAEVAFWRDNWRAEQAEPGMDFDTDYRTAYRYGVDAFTARPDQHFNDIEAQLAQEWEGGARGGSRLGWAQARLATLDAWQRARDLAHRETD